MLSEFAEAFASSHSKVTGSILAPFLERLGLMKLAVLRVYPFTVWR